jgi:carbon monoxide dehydrogenase subunit G
VEIEKTLKLQAAPHQVWALLLDPQVMGGCVPGMKSIDVVSDVEYLAVMHVKIAFINAKFKLRTTIVEQRAPEYLRAEGTGEDASVASSLKQQSEIFLAPTAEGGTELRIKVKVDVLGRLGTFGLSVMKTKADRMWEEFGANLVARIDGSAAPAPAAAKLAAATVGAAAGAPERPVTDAYAYALDPAAAASAAATPRPAGVKPPAVPPPPAPAPASVSGPGWWSRILGGASARDADPTPVGRFVRIEVRKIDRTVTVEWPVEDSQRCQAWLRELMD